MEIGLIFLARAVEPEEKIAAFISSYKKHDAGINHRLIVLYKGGAKHSELFVNIPHQAVNISDDGLDITAYLATAKDCNHRLLCFLNSNTQIRTDGWLKKLINALSIKNVGMVGATGSYESLATSLELMHKVGWLAVRGKLPYDEDFARHYEWLLLQIAPHWLQSIRRPSFKSRVRKFTYPYRWKITWCDKMRPGRNLYYLKQHSRFPNPHIRTNVFAIDRELLLGVTNKDVITKEDAYAFESGKNSLSRQLANKSLRLLVVNSEGQSFDAPDWMKSKTYRINEQELLLASDNQSERYALSDQYERGVLTMMTWGLNALPDNKPPHLGLLEFEKDLSSVEGFARL